MRKLIAAIRRYYDLLGCRGVAAWIYARLTGRHPLLAKKVAGLCQPVYLRVGTTDASVFRQVLVERHYDFDLPATPQVIIDAGANIGLSALFFAHKYPSATVIAIEPSTLNFRVLEKNTSAYPQIKTIHAALWNENGQIELIDPGNGDHGFQTVTKGHAGTRNLGLVPAMTLDSILADMNLDWVDVLKIDIEGAEKEIFENAGLWIARVGAIMIELHDSINAGCSAAFAAATAGFATEQSRGETVLRMK